MWYVNRSFEQAGLIPEAVLLLDNLVLAGDKTRLVEVLTSVLKDGVGEFTGRGRPEPIEKISADLSRWEPAEIADLLWSLLKKEPEEVIWRYIPR